MRLNIFSRSFSSEPWVIVAMERFQNSDIATPTASMMPSVTARRTMTGRAEAQSPVCQDVLITCRAFCKKIVPMELMMAQMTTPARVAGRSTG